MRERRVWPARLCFPPPPPLQVRKVDAPKDQMDREWEEFQKAMRQVNTVSDVGRGKPFRAGTWQSKGARRCLLASVLMPSSCCSVIVMHLVLWALSKKWLVPKSTLDGVRFSQLSVEPVKRPVFCSAWGLLKWCWILGIRFSLPVKLVHFT